MKKGDSGRKETGHLKEQVLPQKHRSKGSVWSMCIQIRPRQIDRGTVSSSSVTGVADVKESTGQKKPHEEETYLPLESQDNAW